MRSAIRSTAMGRPTRTDGRSVPTQPRGSDVQAVVSMVRSNAASALSSPDGVSRSAVTSPATNRTTC